jgi:hypothetical protein
MKIWRELLAVSASGVGAASATTSSPKSRKHFPAKIDFGAIFFLF